MHVNLDGVVELLLTIVSNIHHYDGTDPSVMDYKGNNVLMFAVLNDKEREIIELLSKKGKWLSHL